MYESGLGSWEVARAGHRDEHDEMASLDSGGLLNHCREQGNFFGMLAIARLGAACYGK